MAAREARRIYVLAVRDEVRARPVKSGLQQDARDRPSRHCDRDVDGEVMLAPQQEKAGHRERRESQYDRAAQTRDITGQILDPSGSQRIVAITVFTERE